MGRVARDRGEDMHLKDARIEWNRRGEFRVSNYHDEKPDLKLRRSGGACFAYWREMDDDVRRMLWFYAHVMAALYDECDPQQIIRETEKVIDGFVEPCPEGARGSEPAR